MAKPFEIKPYSLGQLALFYTVNRKTFKKWLEPYHGLVGERIGYLYTVRQVTIIIEVLGPPPSA